MNRIIGFGDFHDNNGQKVFTKHNFIFNFIKTNSAHFDFTLDLNIIQKIFEFCNDSVHKGIMPYYWQMFYAIKFWDTLFYDSNFKGSGSWNINSAIKIKDYDILKQKFEGSIKQSFENGNYDLHFHWIKPEAQIIN